LLCWNRCVLLKHICKFAKKSSHGQEIAPVPLGGRAKASEVTRLHREDAGSQFLRKESRRYAERESKLPHSAAIGLDTPGFKLAHGAGSSRHPLGELSLRELPELARERKAFGAKQLSSQVMVIRTKG
jgi:hypothetical protein